MRLVIDIETIADAERLNLLPEPKPAKNLKDPEKIAASIEEAKKEREEKAALDPDTARILSIGMCMTTDKSAEVYLNNAYCPVRGDAVVVSEAEMLEAFWKMYAKAQGRVIGYNILNFDLPFLLRRSFALCVRPPEGIPLPNLAKYRTEPITDLMAILYNWGGMTYKGLKVVAGLYLDKVINETGADVKAMVEEKRWAELVEYQKRDIEIAKELYHAMNGYYFAHYEGRPWNIS